jgi:putative nucleotidyltransferase with HDIG domain
MARSIQTSADRRHRRLRLYVRTVVAVGVVAVGQSLLASIHTPQPIVWLLFAALAVAAGTFTMKMVSVPATMSVSDTFFFASAMLFGSGPATVAVALASGAVSYRRRHAWQRIAFNTAAPALAMWTGSQIFFRVAGVPPLVQGHQPIQILVVPLLCLTAVYFLLNTGFIALAVALESGAPPLSVWRAHFLWLSLSFFAAASVAFCLILLIQQVSLLAAALVAPLIVIFHLTLRASYGRLEDAQRHLGRMDRLYLSTIETLAMAIDAKDDVTHSHVRRVETYAVDLAKALGITDEATIKAIKAAALLHDTGKLAVPEHILNKPGGLTESEFEKMKLHVDVGADILSLVDFPYPVVPIVRCHHENWNGTGYPRGIAGEEIPIGARILSVVDCYDALTSDRPYRTALSDEAAVEILRGRRGTMYDPRVIDMFIAIRHDIELGHIAHAEHHPALQQISQSRVAASEAAVGAAGVPGASPASDEMLAFVSLARVASGEVATADVLALASNLLRDLVPRATAAWYVLDTAHDRLTVAGAVGPAAAALQGASVGVGQRLTGWVAANRQVIVNSDAALDLGERAKTVVPALESCMSAPLVTGTALVGVLTLYSSEKKAFNDDQGRLIQMITPHIAQAIARAERRQPAEVVSLPRDLRVVSSR